jgi:hypothetical protein
MRREKAGLSWQSCNVCSVLPGPVLAVCVLAVLLWWSCSGRPGYPFLSILLWLSFLAILCRQPCPGRPAQAVLSYHGSLIQPALLCLSQSGCTWQPCTGRPFLETHSWYLDYACPVLPVKSCLSSSFCPVPPVQFCLSRSAFPVLSILFYLSLLYSLWCPVLPVLSW